jgi:hypothetical protein
VFETVPANACQIFLCFKKPNKRKGQKNMEELDPEQVASQLLESMLKESKGGASGGASGSASGGASGGASGKANSSSSSSTGRKATTRRGGKYKKHAA